MPPPPTAATPSSFTPTTPEQPPPSAPSASQPLRRPPPIPPPARSNRRLVTASLVALVAAFFVFPFAYIGRHNSKADKKGHYGGEAAMGRTAIMRGAYINTGSKDVGYDDEFYKRNAEVVRQLAEAQRGGSATVSPDTHMKR